MTGRNSKHMPYALDNFIKELEKPYGDIHLPSSVHHLMLQVLHAVSMDLKSERFADLYRQQFDLKKAVARVIVPVMQMDAIYRQALLDRCLCDKEDIATLERVHSALREGCEALLSQGNNRENFLNLNSVELDVPQGIWTEHPEIFSYEITKQVRKEQMEDSKIIGLVYKDPNGQSKVYNAVQVAPATGLGLRVMFTEEVTGKHLPVMEVIPAQKRAIDYTAEPDEDGVFPEYDVPLNERKPRQLVFKYNEEFTIFASKIPEMVVDPVDQSPAGPTEPSAG